MAKSREKIQQIGFWDAEVSNPDHDAVCLWAYENADLIFRTVCPEVFDQPWKDELHKDEVHIGYGKQDQRDIDLAIAFTKANPRPNPRIIRKTLEFVLKSYTGYQDKMERIVGYADLLIETERPIIKPNYKKATTGYAGPIVDEFQLAWSSDSPSPRILVEAKSVLPTVGELMRQIQLYRTAFRGKFVVVSPDDSYARILAEQGVIFIQYSR